MVVIERSPEQGVQIGRYVLRVLAVHADEVVVALIDPDRDCAGCGERTTGRCRGCAARVCPACARERHCPRCAYRLG
jgi:hypothetical protein